MKMARAPSAWQSSPPPALRSSRSAWRSSTPAAGEPLSAGVNVAKHVSKPRKPNMQSPASCRVAEQAQGMAGALPACRMELSRSEACASAPRVAMGALPESRPSAVPPWRDAAFHCSLCTPTTLRNGWQPAHQAA